MPPFFLLSSHYDMLSIPFIGCCVFKGRCFKRSECAFRGFQALRRPCKPNPYIFGESRRNCRLPPERQDDLKGAVRNERQQTALRYGAMAANSGPPSEWASETGCRFFHLRDALVLWERYAPPLVQGTAQCEGKNAI